MWFPSFLSSLLPSTHFFFKNADIQDTVNRGEGPGFLVHGDTFPIWPFAHFTFIFIRTIHTLSLNSSYLPRLPLAGLSLKTALVGITRSLSNMVIFHDLSLLGVISWLLCGRWAFTLLPCPCQHTLTLLYLHPALALPYLIDQYLLYIIITANDIHGWNK